MFKRRSAERWRRSQRCYRVRGGERGGGVNQTEEDAENLIIFSEGTLKFPELHAGETKQIIAAP